MDVWAWESPAWAEATSIVNCPITRLSLFRTGRGGGEQRIGQGGGNHNSRAGQDGRATELHIVYCVGFTKSPAVASSIAAYVAVSRSIVRADGGRFPPPPELPRLGFSCGLGSSSRAGAEQRDADAIRLRIDGRTSRSSSHRPPLPSRARTAHGWAFRLDMSAYSAAVSHRGKLKEGGA